MQSPDERDSKFEYFMGQTNQRFDRLDQRLDKHELKMDQKFDKVESGFDKVGAQLKTLENWKYQLIGGAMVAIAISTALIRIIWGR